MAEPLALVLGGAAAGLFGSLLGLGGGLLIIPYLTLVFHVPMHTAIATSLICVIATSSAAAAVYVQRHLCDIRLGMLLELATTTGAVAGGLFANILNQHVLETLFAGLMFFTAGSMWRRREGLPEAALVSNADPVNLTERLAYRHLPGGLGISFLAGNLSGLLGVGGGILKVPAMHLVMGVPFKIATATSNLMIGVTAAASGFIFFLRGRVDLPLSAWIVFGVFWGATLGARWATKVKTKTLRLAFVVVLIAVGIEMASKGLALPLPWQR